MRYQRAELPLKLDGLAATRKFFAGCMADADPMRENLWVAHVDDQARCVLVSRYPGEETGASFPLKSIIIDAAEHGSAGILLAHNHPSGDPRPSDSDCRATRTLATAPPPPTSSYSRAPRRPATAAEALDCAVLDHLVFAGNECTSFRRMGLL